MRVALPFQAKVWELAAEWELLKVLGNCSRPLVLVTPTEVLREKALLLLPVFQPPTSSWHWQTQPEVSWEIQEM